MANKALITGIAGQDGSFLADLLRSESKSDKNTAKPENLL